jgi:hypothetical protein
VSEEAKFYKKQSMKILLSLYIVVILFSLLTVASYTWFSLSRTPRISDIYMFVNTASGLELSDDPGAEDEDWQLQLDFRDLVDVTTDLRPITWSDQDNCFYAATYGVDGRQNDRWERLTDERNANKENIEGYYIKATFYARSGQNTRLTLSPAVEVDEGRMGSGTYVIGYPDWDSERVVHNNGGQGAECAVRIGIRLTPVDKDGFTVDGPKEFFIYEPNSDIHIDGSRGYTPTGSIDITPNLVRTDRLILQSASTWTEADPVQRNVVIRDLGEFTTETALYDLEAGQILKIELYIWLEGQDADCTNQINKARILANIQFAGDPEDQSGLKPIE